MKLSLTSLSLVIAFLVTGLNAFADNWGHWRGPTGNSVSPSAKPPTKWGPGSNVKWKTPIPGRGSGSPVIWEDRVFVVSAVPANLGDSADASSGSGRDQRLVVQRPGRGRFGRPGGGSLQTLDFVVFCLDRQSGRLLWKQTATRAKPHQATHQTNGFASASPCTDGEHVYAHFGSRGLHCYTMDGRPVWSRQDFEPMTTRNSFGEGSSPTIAGDKILVPHDHEGQSYLYALDKRTGKTLWKASRDEPTNWSTPLVIGQAGSEQVVMNGQRFARAYDLETGDELWRCGGQTDRPVASAVGADGMVFIGSGYRGAFLGAFRLNGRGDIGGTDNVAWEIQRDTPDIASPLLSQGRLYFHKGKSGQLTCVDAATGKVHYAARRVPGINSTYASPVAAGGNVYLTGRSGTTVVIRDSDRMEVVATNSVGEGVDATPAPVDDELFIRGESHLFCIASK